MKKVVLTLSAFALVAMFAACGGPKSDGEKVGNKYCECQKMDDKAKKKECMKEYRKMNEEMNEKYDEDKAAKKEYRQARDEAKKACSKNNAGDYDIDMSGYEDIDMSEIENAAMDIDMSDFDD